jgi:hypothetical protein
VRSRKKFLTCHQDLPHIAQLIGRIVTHISEYIVEGR